MLIYDVIVKTKQVKLEILYICLGIQIPLLSFYCMYLLWIETQKIEKKISKGEHKL